MGEREDNACHRHLFPKQLRVLTTTPNVRGSAYRGSMSALEDEKLQ
jgi:hypothetical protein